MFAKTVSRLFVFFMFAAFMLSAVGPAAARGDSSPALAPMLAPSLDWNTFGGSTTADNGSDIAVDSSGSSYVVGYSSTTWGAPINAYAGLSDAFVAKYDSSGALVWNTFLGSSNYDQGQGIAVDTAGNSYIVGHSYGTTWGAPINAFAGDYDAFIAKLDSSGALVWSTFLGSSLTDQSFEVTVDSAGNAYVTGYSQATWGAPINTHAGSGGVDVFVAKLDSSGGLVWNTFLGSSSDDTSYNIVVDTAGNPYVTGFSNATWGAPVNAYAGGGDAFAAKLNMNGALVWNTFLGSGDYDLGTGIAIDSADNAYLTGFSNIGWGTPVNTHAGGYDAYVAKLASSGVLVWNTFLGSSSNDMSYGIAVDSAGNPYVTGHSFAAWGAPINAHAGGYDAYVAKLAPSGVLTWNTFLGSGSEDYSYGIAVDAAGNAYVTGYSDATWGAPINAHAGNYDAFVARITQDSTTPDVAISSPSADPTNSSPIPVTVQFTETVTGFDANDLSALNGTVSNFAAVDGDTYRFDLTPLAVGDVTVDIAGGAAQDISGNPNNAAPQFIRRYDNVAPSVTAFSAPMSSTSLNIPISTFTASDNLVGVSGYMITESATPPLVTNAGWSASAPATYNVLANGLYTLYPWAKDAAGNVSSVFGSPLNITVDTISPVVLSITRLDPNPTTGTSMNFAVTFSEPVTGVDLADFLPLPAGTLSGVTVSGLSGSDASYTVTVNIVTGSGTLTLALSDNDSISDAAGNLLGGSGAGNGDFTGGEAYTRYQPTTTNFASLGTYDGHIIESNENSNSGGTATPTGTSLNVGDGTSDRQYRGFLHFNTASLPDGAVITSLSIRVRLLGITGANPFLTHGNLQVDIRLPFFGTAIGLAASDFQSAPSAANAGFFNPTPLAGNWYNANLTNAALPFLNLTGTTQFRLSFTLDDNDDGGADALRFYSGNATASNRPVLIVTYYVP